MLHASCLMTHGSWEWLMGMAHAPSSKKERGAGGPGPGPGPRSFFEDGAWAMPMSHAHEP